MAITHTCEQDNKAISALTVALKIHTHTHTHTHTCTFIHSYTISYNDRKLN